MAVHFLLSFGNLQEARSTGKTRPYLTNFRRTIADNRYNYPCRWQSLLDAVRYPPPFSGTRLCAYCSPRWRALSIIGFATCSPVLARSEEHTSELQSRPHLVCRLLLEKKKKI